MVCSYIVNKRRREKRVQQFVRYLWALIIGFMLGSLLIAKMMHNPVPTVAFSDNRCLWVVNTDGKTQKCTAGVLKEDYIHTNVK